PFVHLLLAPLLARIVLVQSDKIAVVALVEGLIPFLRQAGQPHFGQRECKRALGADQGRGEDEIEGKSLRLHAAPGFLGFLDSGRAQIHVPPSREQVLEVPFALAMAQQDEKTIGGHGNSLWLESDARLLKAWRIGGANPKTEWPIIRNDIVAGRSAR